MKALPVAARIYVCAIIGLGAGLLAAFFPREFTHSPWLFLALLLLSSVTSVFKVNLPLARRSSTMSVSYAVDFASLLLLGPNETMIVAAPTSGRATPTTVWASVPGTPPSASYAKPEACTVIARQAMLNIVR